MSESSGWKRQLKPGYHLGKSGGVTGGGGADGAQAGAWALGGWTVFMDSAGDCQVTSSDEMWPQIKQCLLNTMWAWGGRDKPESLAGSIWLLDHSPNVEASTALPLF